MTSFVSPSAAISKLTVPDWENLPERTEWESQRYAIKLSGQGSRPTEFLYRKGPNTKWGDHGSFAIPIITDRSGEEKTIITLAPRDAPGRISMEFPSAMAWTEGNQKDNSALDTAERAMRSKTGIKGSGADGSGQPTVLLDLGSHLTHPGTENTQKRAFVLHYDLPDVDLSADGSNLPVKTKEETGYTPTDSTAKSFASTPMVVPLKELSNFVKAYSEYDDGKGTRIVPDAPLGFTHAWLSAMGNDTFSSLSASAGSKA